MQPDPSNEWQSSQRFNSYMAIAFTRHEDHSELNKFLVCMPTLEVPFQNEDSIQTYQLSMDLITKCVRHGSTQPGPHPLIHLLLESGFGRTTMSS